MGPFGEHSVKFLSANLRIIITIRSRFLVMVFWGIGYLLLFQLYQPIKVATVARSISTEHEKLKSKFSIKMIAENGP